MPITQDRMIAVLNEAHSAREALRNMKSEIQRIMDHTDNAQVTLAAIRLVLETTNLPEMPRTLIETAHFDRARKSNERNAGYMAVKRRNGL